MITIGTDCSGIEAPIEALKQLGIPFQHKWSCEIDKFARQSIMANSPPEVMYTDITQRDHLQLPDVDLYVCGFPCQSFSIMGRKLGTQDPRGNIMLHCIDVIEKKLPRVFILENVKNFKYIENGTPYNFLMSTLEGIKDEEGNAIYNVHADIYNTKEYGIPQNRERIYIIGVMADIQTNSFLKPSPMPLQSLESFLLDTRIMNVHPYKSAIHQWNKKKTTSDGNYVISCAGHGSIFEECCPTMTCTTRLYLTKYRRYIQPLECMLLQGFSYSFVQVVSNTQLYKQAGNSMSVNVLKAIFTGIFQCTSHLFTTT